jgi:hypothetical protein
MSSRAGGLIEAIVMNQSYGRGATAVFRGGLRVVRAPLSFHGGDDRCEAELPRCVDITTEFEATAKLHAEEAIGPGCEGARSLEGVLGASECSGCREQGCDGLSERLDCGPGHMGAWRKNKMVSGWHIVSEAPELPGQFAYVGAAYSSHAISEFGDGGFADEPNEVFSVANVFVE